MRALLMPKRQVLILKLDIVVPFLDILTKMDRLTGLPMYEM